MRRIRRRPALSLLASFVVATVAFVACSGGDDSRFTSSEARNGPCEPRTVRECFGPRMCVGEQTCLPNGQQYTACICMGGPNATGGASGDAATSNGDAATDGPTSNGDASTDGPTSNDGSDDGPTSGDASDDGPTSGDASDDGPTSGDAEGIPLLKYFRGARELEGGTGDDSPR